MTIQKILLKAIKYQKNGRLAEAENLYETILKTDPHHPDTNYNLGMLYTQKNKIEEAISFFEKALHFDPQNKQFQQVLANSKEKFQQQILDEQLIELMNQQRYEEALVLAKEAVQNNSNYTFGWKVIGTVFTIVEDYHNALQPLQKTVALNSQDTETYFTLGNVLKELGKLEDAVHIYQKAISIKPDDFRAYYHLGITLQELGKLEDAIQIYKKAIRIKPDFILVYFNLGNVLKELGKLEDAVQMYKKVISIKPDFTWVYFNLGNVFKELGKLADAVQNYLTAISIKPDFSEAYFNLGGTLKELGRLEDAVQSYNKAIDIRPDYAEAYLNQGVVLQELGRLQDSIEAYNKAIDLKLDYAQAYYNQGNAFKELGRLEDAVQSYNKAIDIRPDYAEAHLNLGVIFKELGRLEDAERCFKKVISIQPNFATAYSNLGVIFKELGKLEDAVKCYNKAISIQPDSAEVYYNLGYAFKELDRLEDAVQSYDRAMSIKPDYEFLSGHKIYTQMHLCDWKDFTSEISNLEVMIAAKKKVAVPFFVLGLFDNPEIQKTAAEVYAQAKYPISQDVHEFHIRSKNEKIRIGYYSADFRNHPMMHLMAELFESHDSEIFEWYAFSFGPKSEDAVYQRVSKAFTTFYDVTKMSDHEIVALSRELKMDIAVDLMAYTQYSRTEIFSKRCAPLQINYLGYPGTMGATFMDYIIADHTLIPPQSQKYFSEKVIYMPHSYQVNDSTRQISDRVFTRQELGLPEDSFIFCCFNHNYKILPATFESWMRILMNVEGSILWLLESNPTASQNLRKEAISRGIDANRLVFAQRMPIDEHLARHRVADLFLDTLPYNAHTTASDALWTGLPVLTYKGESFTSRVAASLLNTIDLPELITQTQQEYESKAIEFATNPAMLLEIKEKLKHNRSISPLFDGKKYTRDLEQAYLLIYDRYRTGLKPDELHI